MRTLRLVCVTVLALFLASCALGDTAPRTPPPPVTVSPPPTITFSGDCEVNRELSDWLEYSTFYVGKFVDLISAAGAKPSDAVYDDVVLMGRLRGDFSSVPVPNCAEPVEGMILTAMSGAIDGFQSYANGDSDSVSNLVADTLRQFDLVTAGQQGLNAQLETQLRGQ